MVHVYWEWCSFLVQVWCNASDTCSSLSFCPVSLYLFKSAYCGNIDISTFLLGVVQFLSTYMVWWNVRDTYSSSSFCSESLYPIKSVYCIGYESQACVWSRFLSLMVFSDRLWSASHVGWSHHTFTSHWLCKQMAQFFSQHDTVILFVLELICEDARFWMTWHEVETCVNMDPALQVNDNDMRSHKVICRELHFS